MRKAQAPTVATITWRAIAPEIGLFSLAAGSIAFRHTDRAANAQTRTSGLALKRRGSSLTYCAPDWLRLSAA
jgi:hypothetical protein